MKLIKTVTKVILIIFLINVYANITSYAATDEAGVFISTNYTGNDRNIPYNSARVGLQRLGYRITTSISNTTTKKEMMDYIKSSGRNYAFFARVHGDDGIIVADKNNSSTEIRSTEITGNWHLVVIPSCSSGESTKFANAFKVNTANGTNKAFLGYYKEVLTDVNTKWNELFWSYVGSRSLRDATLDASDYWTSPGTCPVRMYGDKTWWGWAW